jgi:hypothetical protein
MPPAKNRPQPSDGITIILPSRWFDFPAFERDWVSNFVKELGRLHHDVAVVPYPGLFVGEIRNGLSFAAGAWDHFKSQLTERVWQASHGILVFIGDAASPDVFHQVMQHAPFVHRASVPLIGLPSPNSIDINGIRQFSHYVIFPGAWNKRNASKIGDGIHSFSGVQSFEDGVGAANFLHQQSRRFVGLNRLHRESGSNGLTVIAVQQGLVNAARKLVQSYGGRGEVVTLGDGRAVSGSSQVPMASAQLAQARYRRILFLNEGVVSAEGLARMTAYLDRHPLLGVVGAVPVKRASSRRPKSQLPMGFIHVENGKSVFPMAWITRRSTLLNVGYFDNRFETLDAAIADFCLRIRQLGFHVFSAGEIHASKRSINKPPIIERKWRISKKKDILKLCRKWAPPVMSRALRSGEAHEDVKTGAYV